MHRDPFYFFDKECFLMEAPAWDMVTSKSLTLASASRAVEIDCSILIQVSQLGIGISIVKTLFISDRAHGLSLWHDFC